MQFGFFEILKLFGGLALYIFGMRIMSNGIQRVMSKQLKRMLQAMKGNRLTGVLSGLLSTSIIQSSSSTSVMLVSFVNAGLLNLRQAISAIMGANIGTTITAWIIAVLGFKYELWNYSFPILLIGIPFLFIRGEQGRSFGEFIAGLSLLFLGLNELNNMVQLIDLQNNLAFQDFIQNINNHRFSSTFLFVILGILLTMVVQSSGAAIALTLTFVGVGFPVEYAMAIVLGENIGTTITANLAALIGNVNAKRAARAHMLFNVMGLVWALILFTPFVTFISNWISDLADITITSSSKEVANVRRYSVASFHTLFNVINTILFIGFVKFLERSAKTMVFQKRDSKEPYSLQFIAQEVVSSPEVAFLEARKEIKQFVKVIKNMNANVKELILVTEENRFNRLLNKIGEMEDLTDKMEVELADFLIKVSQNSMSQKASLKVKGLQNVISDLERTGDIYYRMALLLKKKREAKQWFVQKQRDHLNEFMDMLEESLNKLLVNIDLDAKDIELGDSLELEERINNKRDLVLNDHLESMERGEYKLQSGVFYKDLFSSCEKLGDYIYNISKMLKKES